MRRRCTTVNPGSGRTRTDARSVQRPQPAVGVGGSVGPATRPELRGGRPASPAVAATALKWSTEIDRLPMGEHSNHLASIRFSHGARPARTISISSRRFAGAIPTAGRSRRRRPTPASPPLHEMLRPGTRVTVLDQGARTVLGAATELTAAVRRYDSAYQTEIHWWTGHTVDTVGIPPEALATAEQSAHVEIGRRFPPGTRTSADTPGADRSTVVLVSTEATGERTGCARAKHCRRCCSKRPQSGSPRARSPT